MYTHPCNVGTDRPVRIVLGNFWRLEQLLAVLATSRNFLSFWAIFQQNINTKHEKKSAISQKTSIHQNFVKVKRGFSSVGNVQQPFEHAISHYVSQALKGNYYRMNNQLISLNFHPSLKLSFTFWHSSKQLSSILRAQSGQEQVQRQRNNPPYQEKMHGAWNQKQWNRLIMHHTTETFPHAKTNINIVSSRKSISFSNCQSFFVTFFCLTLQIMTNDLSAILVKFQTLNVPEICFPKIRTLR